MNKQNINNLTTIFPHIELAIAGIVQLNMYGDESC